MILVKQWLLMVILMEVCLGIEPQLPSHIIQVYGNATLGYYYVNLYIGTPPQEQSVIIDTGSGLLALPCSRCFSCGNSHIHRPFDLQQSSSSKIITCKSGHELCKERCHQQSEDACTFLISYAQGSSLSGIIIEDAIQFQQNSKGESITTTFGCTVRQTNLFYTQAANGIFGLAPHRKARLLDLLYQKHSQFTGQEFLFSICLAKNGGQLAIGKVADGLIKDKQSVKTTFDSGRNLYSLNSVGTISMNGTILRDGQSLGYFGLFIDTGSTFTYFRSTQYNKMLQEIQNSCAYHPTQCKIAKKSGMKCVKIDISQGQSLRQALLQIFPTLEIEINGQVVGWKPDRYFLLRNRHTGEACLGIESLDRFLLGANWMVDRNVVFNLKDQTVEIYSGVDCVPSSGREELPIYTDDNSGPLPYISAVLKINEETLAKLIIFILIAIAIVVLLLCIGVYRFKRSPQVPAKKQQHPQEENVTIVDIRNNSQRGLEECHEELKPDELPSEVQVAAE